MIQFVTVIHVVVCVLLVLVVLLQQGKKDGMGAAFGGGSSSVFGARGAETFLEKITKVLAVVFMSTSLAMVYLSSRESIDSLLSNEKATTQSPVKVDQSAKATTGTINESAAQSAATAPSSDQNAEKSAPSNAVPSE